MLPATTDKKLQAANIFPDFSDPGYPSAEFGLPISY